MLYYSILILLLRNTVPTLNINIKFNDLTSRIKINKGHVAMSYTMYCINKPGLLSSISKKIAVGSFVTIFPTKYVALSL